MNDSEPIADPNTEIVDLYDSNRHPLGMTAPRYSKLEEGVFRQVVHICLFHNGRMLLQLRSPNTRKHRRKWDFTASGGVKAGETPQQAATRELYEELGIRYDFSDSQPVITFYLHPNIHDYFIGILEDEVKTFTLNDEVDGVCWGDKVTLNMLIDRKLFVIEDKTMTNKLFNAYKRIMKKQKRSEEIV